jgi:hypothetical protein
MSDDLLKLGERCEAAAGSDRELDREIARSIDLFAGTRASYDLNIVMVPKYTLSVDAAMSLVPEGCAWTLYSDGPTCIASAEIGPHPTGGQLMQAQWSGEGETPALALCAAALRARARSAA